MTNQRTRWAYVNGAYVDESQAVVSIYDSALWVGDMIFDICRSYNRRLWKLPEHIDRLFDGMKILRIDIGLNPTQVQDICYRVAELNEDQIDEDDEHRIMISVSRGLIDVGQDNFQEQSGPTILVTDLPVKNRIWNFAPLLNTGVNAVIPSQRSIPAHLIDPKVKHRSRIWMKMSDFEIQDQKGSNNWALWTDTDGYITEGPSHNFFMVKDGVILTPEGRNILRGVCREYIFELANKLGLPCKEQNIDFFDVCTADEAFMTGTLFSMIPVTAINHRPIRDGKTGPITQLLLDTWSQEVGIDIQGQLRHYGKIAGVL